MNWGDDIRQLPNEFFSTSSEPPEYGIFYWSVWVSSFTDSYLPDTDNIVPFENTTPINQNNGQSKRTLNQGC